MEVALNPSLEARFAEALRGLLPDGARRLLVACSGGGDSAALAALTAAAAPALGLETALAHCDHGLRVGSAAEADAVRALGARLGLPVHALSLAIPAGGNLEAAARRARYAALGELAESLGAAAILTGHSADDLAETLWLWLLRGTGPTGLSPLPASRPIRPGSALLVLRPLLGFRREALRDYLRAGAIPWLEDPSNADLDLRRNRVRHRLLPGLAADYGIDPTGNALRLGAQMAELLAFLDAELAARGLDEAALAASAWSQPLLAGLPPVLARRFLSQALALRGLFAPHVVDRALGGLGAPHDFVSLGVDRAGQWELALDGTQVELVRLGDASLTPQVPQIDWESRATITLPAATDARLPLGGGWTLRLERRAGNPGPPTRAGSAVFDAELLAEPLRLVAGGAVAGRRIRLLGGPGSRLVSDVFIDRKVPRRWRAGWPLLLDAQDHLLWVPGLARGEQAPVGPQTQRCLCLDLEPPSA
jgi:tRNA(Ile)-lysidine synthetase-like protein